MKLFAKLMIAALFIAMLLPFTILKGRDGKALMSFSSIELPGLPDFSMPQLPKSSVPIPGDDNDLSGKDLFYKWYDAEGNVQFTSEPPADGIEYTIKGYDPDANVIQAVEMPPQKRAAGEGDSSGIKATESKGLENPYSHESIKKLIDDAKNVEEILNQRFKDQKSAVNQ